MCGAGKCSFEMMKTRSKLHKKSDEEIKKIAKGASDAFIGDTLKIYRRDDQLYGNMFPWVNHGYAGQILTINKEGAAAPAYASCTDKQKYIGSSSKYRLLCLCEDSYDGMQRIERITPLQAAAAAAAAASTTALVEDKNTGAAGRAVSLLHRSTKRRARKRLNTWKRKRRGYDQRPSRGGEKKSGVATKELLSLESSKRTPGGSLSSLFSRSSEKNANKIVSGAAARKATSPTSRKKKLKRTTKTRPVPGRPRAGQKHKKLKIRASLVARRARRIIKNNLVSLLSRKHRTAVARGSISQNYEVWQGWPNNAGLMSVQTTGIDQATCQGMVPAGGGYYYDSVSSGGWCKTIIAANVAAVRAALTTSWHVGLGYVDQCDK